MLVHWKAEQSQDWDRHVAKSRDGGLLQSWAWGEFQEALGNAVYNVSDEKKTWFAQCIQLRAGNQWILTVPRGPVYVGDSSVVGTKDFFTDLQSFAKQRGCFLVRLDPAFNEDLADTIISAGARKAKRERNPKQTLIIDTSAGEEELLAAMKSKWRYNIRLSEKKGVTVRLSNAADDAAVFWQLVEKTTDRQGFASYDEDYFRVLMNALGPKQQAAFLIAEMQGKPIAALLLGFFGSVAYYLHGASDYEYRQFMAPHLLQWRGILEAKKRGMSYDFWGVSHQDWPGVTRFKQGFAADHPFTNYIGAYELPAKPLLYALYRLRALFSK